VEGGIWPTKNFWCCTPYGLILQLLGPQPDSREAARSQARGYRESVTNQQKGQLLGLRRYVRKSRVENKDISRHRTLRHHYPTTVNTCLKTKSVTKIKLNKINVFTIGVLRLQSSQHFDVRTNSDVR